MQPGQFKTLAPPGRDQHPRWTTLSRISSPGHYARAGIGRGCWYAGFLNRSRAVLRLYFAGNHAGHTHAYSGGGGGTMPESNRSHLRRTYSNTIGGTRCITQFPLRLTRIRTANHRATGPLHGTVGSSPNLSTTGG